MALAFSDYERLDALGVAEAIARGDFTAAEAVEAAIARAEAVQPLLNALTVRRFDRARQEARETSVAGRFGGVPFLLKDLLAHMPGEPVNFGSRFFRDYLADHEGELVRRFRAAGLIVIGRTSTPEYGLMPVTEPRAFGPCRNPWNPQRTPGGSSGGSAALVAAGVVPMAHGSDGGGSIRIPASACGLFGLKPSRGRNPLGPVLSEAWHGAVVEHVISRTVRDSAAVLDQTSGADIGVPYDAPATGNFLAECSRPPGRLRIAAMTTAWGGPRAHPDCAAAVEGAARLCEQLGHIVTDEYPKLDLEGLLHAFIVMLSSETAAEIRESERLLGRRANSDDLEMQTRLLAMVGEQFSGPDLAQAVRRLQSVGRDLGHFLTRHDLILTPTLGLPPLSIGSLDPSAAETTALRLLSAIGSGRLVRMLGGVERLSEPIFRFIPFTPVANVSGLPAMSVPLHFNGEGLPIGVQFIARYGDEATLFRLAAQLETAAPWRDRRPPLNPG
ncbi:MAG: amidase [Alphaproteobacteria bacterium]|nr:amidase [Alphaproteobacteria bacterium]